MKKFLILALSAALLAAFFGCGSPKEQVKPEGEEILLALPDPTNAATPTGEENSKMYKFSGDAFTKIQEANPGSTLEITYTANVTYAIGEAGWIDKDNAGPVISGNGSKQTVHYDIEDLVLGTDNFTLHIFNGATLLEVILFAVPEGYEVKKNELATAGATKIVLPQGHKIPGRGDLSKVDYKKIREATGKTLVFYFDDKADTESGILKFGPKSGAPYNHFGINEDVEKDGIIGLTDKTGWKHANLTDNEKVRKIEYTVADINASFPAAETNKTKPTEVYNKLEINNDASGKEGTLLYIELK